jgi:Na+/proline symporter
MNTRMANLDWTIIAVYLLAVVGLGVAAGFQRRKGERGGEGGHYFLAGNTLGWPVIGLAMFAANISTVHLVSLAEAAYKFGLVFGNFEWMAGFTLVLGVLTGIYTMVGGLLAVVWTESVQTVLLLIGAVVITTVGYIKIGGWSALAQTLVSLVKTASTNYSPASSLTRTGTGLITR